MSQVTIPGVKHERIDAITDHRGRFVEIIRFGELHGVYVQVNHSHSHPNVLRGMHYHRKQADLCYLASGRALVALADLRSGEAGLRTSTLVLDGDEPSYLYIPPGVAHGFWAETAIDLIYFVTEEYDGSDEHGIAWDDPKLGVPWPTASPLLSDRDSRNPPLDWEGLPSF